MPLGILFILVVGGISAVAAAMHFLGLSTRKTFDGSAAVRAAWADEFADDPARDITISGDRHAALIATNNGRPGIVFPMGADSTARYIDGSVATPTKRGLRIKIDDFTAPRIRLRMPPDEAARWSEIIAKSQLEDT